MKGKRVTQRKKWLDVVILVVCAVAMVLAGGSAWLGQRADAQQTERQRQIEAARAECFERYANQMADALEARTDSTAPREEAQRRFYYALLGLTEGKNTRAAARKAVQDYVAADRKLQQERAKTPYPDPPREVCPRG